MKRITLETTNKETLKHEVNDFIVASTKSRNNLIAELKAQGNYVDLVKEFDFYIDRDIVNEFAKELASKVKQPIEDNIINALEIACIVKRIG